jgi:hypothetical protein
MALQHTTWPQAGAEYERRRLEAFRLAVDSDRDGALIELTYGWSDLAPPPSLYLADVARVHYLAGDYGATLIAIDLNRGLGGVEQEALVLDCVRREPRLWRAAARIVFRNGPSSVLRVLRVRLSRS